MKFVALIIWTTCLSYAAFSQKKDRLTKEELLKSRSDNACKCIDSISVSDQSKEVVTQKISKCINKEVAAYELSVKLLIDMKNPGKGKEDKKQTIILNGDENSSEYREYYYEMERYMMSHCNSLQEKVATNEKQSEKSFSQNQKALDYYKSGLDESNQGHYKEAINFFEKAVSEDPQFAFAWDNMGMSYRKLEDYDRALEIYRKSLAVDPKGLMPLQNIAVIYQLKKEYPKAITAYEKLAEVDKNNPEVYFGMGQIYSINLQDYEKGLNMMCKAYNLYAEQKSPYRTDAEKVIQNIYAVMKQRGQEKQFNEILKQNNISPK